MTTQLELFLRDESEENEQLALFNYEDRDTEIKRHEIRVTKIGLNAARDFYNKYHYARGCSNSATSFAVYQAVTHELLACVSFQTPCSELVRASVLGEAYKDHVAELGRLAIKSGIRIAASMFVPLCIEAYQADRLERGMTPIYALISFADGAEDHHGGVYQAMSWIYTGESKNTKPVYRDASGRRRHNRQCGKNIYPKEARDKGWSVTQAHSSKYRYIKMIYGSKRFRRKMLKLSKYLPLPYPKPKR